ALDDLVAAAARPSVAAVEREIEAIVLAATGEPVRVVRTTDGSRQFVLPAAFVEPVAVEAAAATAATAVEAPATDPGVDPGVAESAAVEQREDDRPLLGTSDPQVALVGRPDQKEAHFQ